MAHATIAPGKMPAIARGFLPLRPHPSPASHPAKIRPLTPRKAAADRPAPSGFPLDLPGAFGFLRRVLNEGNH